MRPTATTAAPPRAVPTPAPVGEVGGREQLAARLKLRPDAAWALAGFSLDVSLLAAAGLAAALGSRAAGIEAPPVGWVALFAVFVLTTFAARGMYRPRLRAELLEDLRVVVAATSLAAMAVLTLRELTTEPPDLAPQMIRPWAFAMVYLAAGRVALHWSQTQARRNGEALRPTLIVGAGRIGRLTAKRLLEQPELGLRPIGFLDKEPMDVEGGGAVLPVLGASWDLDRVVEKHDVRQVIVTFSTAPDEVLLRLFRRCEELGVTVAFVPRLFEKVTGRLTVDYLGALPLLAARAPNPRGVQFAVKYAVDRALAALLLVLAAPFMVVASIGILVTLGRPIFFRQARVGRDGRQFEMLKFRTMRTPDWDGDRAELELPPDTAPGGVEGADRRTTFGAFLRRMSIDELPQLVNVLRGDMSLIGPRPERPQFVGLFEQSVYRYGERHRVKSGITGWAQVNGLRGKTSLADRVEWDNYYIENWSLWLDFKIALRTAVAVLRSSRQVE
ncbi:MAG TPA: exopolysaccharide biosynthesis polyprenyl glycosylphosphotransferase [Gaiellaceae bacterium]|jgi:exopolysaccharide biosynthesis polyprenyl glycosylphosphotransferase|nr:exopolysaccharide biosynthesis polyprenyl glycosylphosphotransferase [Gaiellaceae bacterium]